jgi:hypothetical protein
MSDLMLFGVLRMPYEMAMSGELSRRQFYSRAQEAADRIERLERELAEAKLQQLADLGQDIERELAERKPASIDTPEFRRLMDDLGAASVDAHCCGNDAGIDHALAALIAYIDGRTAGTAPVDPMDWPIPCDVTTGAVTIRKGCKLRTLVTRMESLHRMATAALPTLTQEQKDANWNALMAAAAPSPQSKQEEANEN